MMNRGLLAGVYSVSILLGLATLLFPAPSIEGVIGLVFAYVYGAFILLGAIVALVGIILPNYKIEYAALWAVAGGYLIYDIALWGLFFQRIAVPDGLPPPYGPALAVLVLSIFLMAKIALLYKKNRQLVKAADNGILA